MPSEMRRIIFSNDELRQAIDAYLLSRHEVLPVGYVHSARVGEDKTQVVLSVHDRAQGKTHEAVLSAASVAAALIRFCFAYDIPLPRNAAKSISVFDGHVALEVRKGPKSAKAVACSVTKQAG